MILPSLLSFIAFIALIFKLPGVLESYCPTCTETSPWIPLVGGAYFAWLAAFFLLGACRLTPLMARTGVVWSLALFLFLTLKSSTFCLPCLIAHGCHITSWLLATRENEKHEALSPLSLFAIGSAPLIGASFILSLNLSLLLYGLPHTLFPSSLIQADTSTLELHTPYLSGSDFAPYANTVVLFAGPGCPHCKKLFPSLQRIAESLKGNRFLLVARQLNEEMKEALPGFENIEDPEGALIKEWGIPGFPTLVVIDRHAKVVKVIAGGLDDTARLIEESLKASH